MVHSEFPSYLEKPGNFTLTFPGLENAWNLLKKCAITVIVTQNMKQTWNF